MRIIQNQIGKSAIVTGSWNARCKANRFQMSAMQETFAEIDDYIKVKHTPL